MRENEEKGESSSEERAASIERATFRAVMGDYHDVTTERVGNRPPHKPAHVALPHKGLVWTGNGLVTTRSVCGIEPKHIGDTLTVEVRRFE